MNLYRLFIRPVLLRFDPETVHKFTFKCFKLFQKSALIRSMVSAQFSVKNPKLVRNLFGLTFQNPVGLAAGLDKNAEAFDFLGCMGFGFIEIGTVTPKAQVGNPLPRLFRFVNDKALVNRMGFNNEGVEEIVQRLRKKRTQILIGGNIGKNKLTPNEDATSDYIKCFDALYPFVDYFVVNVSSPNTPNLRELQDKIPLTQLLNDLMNINCSKGKIKPILLKIAPDLNSSQLDDIVDIVKKTKIDGIVSSNTTISRDGLSYTDKQIKKVGAGGISGQPLRNRSTEVIRYIHKKSNGSIPIIGVGGIMSKEDALEKLNAGASLIQLYTGFIYEGPALVKAINKELLRKTL